MLTDERIMEIEHDVTGYAIHRLDAIPFAKAVAAATIKECANAVSDDLHYERAILALLESPDEAAT